MVENQVVVSKNKEIIPFYLNENKIVRPNCKICKHEDREEIEQLYENQPRKNWTQLKTKLKNDKDFDITINAIKNHMINHYEIENKNKDLSEYSKKVQEYTEMQTDKISALRTKKAILEKELYDIGAKGDELDIIERRRNAEIMNKIAKTLLEYENKIQEYESEYEPVTLVFKQLNIIIKDEIKRNDDNTTKRTLKEVLERLKNDIGDMLIKE